MQGQGGVPGFIRSLAQEHPDQFKLPEPMGGLEYAGKAAWMAGAAFLQSAGADLVTGVGALGGKALQTGYHELFGGPTPDLTSWTQSDVFQVRKWLLDDQALAELQQFEGDSGLGSIRRIGEGIGSVLGWVYGFPGKAAEKIGAALVGKSLAGRLAKLEAEDLARATLLRTTLLKSDKLGKLTGEELGALRSAGELIAKQATEGDRIAMWEMLTKAGAAEQNAVTGAKMLNAAKRWGLPAAQQMASFPIVTFLEGKPPGGGQPADYSLDARMGAAFHAAMLAPVFTISGAAGEALGSKLASLGLSPRVAGTVAGVAEGFGFSMLEFDLMQEGIDAAMRGDWAGTKRALEHAASSMLAFGFMKGVRPRFLDEARRWQPQEYGPSPEYQRAVSEIKLNPETADLLWGVGADVKTVKEEKVPRGTQTVQSEVTGQAKRPIGQIWSFRGPRGLREEFSIHRERAKAGEEASAEGDKLVLVRGRKGHQQIIEGEAEVLAYLDRFAADARTAAMKGRALTKLGFEPAGTHFGVFVSPNGLYSVRFDAQGRMWEQPTKIMEHEADRRWTQVQMPVSQMRDRYGFSEEQKLPHGVRSRPPEQDIRGADRESRQAWEGTRQVWGEIRDLLVREGVLGKSDPVVKDLNEIIRNGWQSLESSPDILKELIATMSTPEYLQTAKAAIMGDPMAAKRMITGLQLVASGQVTADSALQYLVNGRIYDTNIAQGMAEDQAVMAAIRETNAKELMTAIQAGELGPVEAAQQIGQYVEQVRQKVRAEQQGAHSQKAEEAARALIAGSEAVAESSTGGEKTLPVNITPEAMKAATAETKALVSDVKTAVERLLTQPGFGFPEFRGQLQVQTLAGQQTPVFVTPDQTFVGIPDANQGSRFKRLFASIVRAFTGKARTEIEHYARELVKDTLSEIDVRRFRVKMSHDQIRRKWGKNEEDMTAYLEGTGNPLIPGDTLDGVKGRLPQDAKDFIDKTLRPHLDSIWEYLYKENYLKGPDFVVDYITHMWAGAPAGKADQFFEKINEKLGKPAGSRQRIPTYFDGMNDLGLVPRSLKISDIMSFYESRALGAQVQGAMIEHLKGTAVGGQALLIPSKQAEFDGPWVRMKHPALMGYAVHRDLAKPLEKVFDSSMSGYEWTHNLRVANLTAKNLKLFGSLFHLESLVESAVQIGGVRGAVTAARSIFEGIGETLTGKPGKLRDALLERYGEEATRAGLSITPPHDVGKAEVDRMLGGLDMQGRMKGGPFRAPLGVLAKIGLRAKLAFDRVLWGYLHTNSKLWAWNKVRERAYKRAAKEFESLDAAGQDRLKAKLDREAAMFVNDAFGGQNWNYYFRGMRNRRQRALWQMALLAPDWTLSNLKVFGRAIPGAPGAESMKPEARWYMARSAIMLTGVLQGLQWIYGNVILSKEDREALAKEGKSLSILENDPNVKLKNLPVLGFRVGKDPKTGQWEYATPLKQITEVMRWAIDPIEISGSKMSPFLKALMVTYTGHSPGSGFPAPWEGQDFWDSVPERLKSAATSALPISITVKDGKIELNDRQWMFTLPKRRGLTKYTTTKLFTEYMAELGTTEDPQPVLDGLDRILKDAKSNNINYKDALQTALFATRARYYEAMMDALNQGDEAGAEKAADALSRLGVEKGAARGTLKKRFSGLIERGEALMDESEWRRRVLPSALRMLRVRAGVPVRQYRKKVEREYKLKERERLQASYVR